MATNKQQLVTPAAAMTVGGSSVAILLIVYLVRALSGGRVGGLWLLWIVAFLAFLVSIGQAIRSKWNWKDILTYFAILVNVAAIFSSVVGANEYLSELVQKQLSPAEVAEVIEVIPEEGVLPIPTRSPEEVVKLLSSEVPTSTLEVLPEEQFEKLQRLSEEEILDLLFVLDTRSAPVPSFFPPVH